MKTTKGKEYKVDALNKTEIINSMQKRSLKVVLCRNQYFPIKSISKKSALIQELISNEKKCLKLNRRRASNLQTDDELTEKIKRLVEQKKADIFIDDDESDHIGSPPAKVLQAIKNQKDKQREQQQAENVPFAVIPKHKINKFFALLSSRENISEYQRRLNVCSAQLRTQFRKPHWNSPSCIMKAIQDSVLRRKWRNLTQLLLMLLNLPPVRYAPFIRYICQFMTRLHPIIQEQGLTDQFAMVQQVYKRNY